MCLRLLLLFLLFLGPCEVRGHRERRADEASERLSKLEKVTSQLTRQLMLQQLYVEEAARSSLDSGIKHTRRRIDGPKSYFSATYTTRSVAAMHDHSDHVNTAGMGELIAVLNGVEFRTRHNDYKLRMPSRTSQEYHATEIIPYPEVPQEVLKRTSVEEQNAEMREWFRAWIQGNHTERDYRNYFRPNLCYLEGTWTTDETLDEPFESDRHHLEAESWFELQEYIRFTSYTGTKSKQENFAYLPTTLMNVTEDGLPVFGQWNYRILCHPVKGDLELSVFQPVDNLARRLANQETFDDYVLSRAARFRLDANEGDKSYRWSLLDKLMYQIPGKDNYNASLYDDPTSDQQRVTADSEEPLNAGFYHRVHKILQKDAMGEKTTFKGFADRNLFVAETTQPRVAAMSIPDCKSKKDRRDGTCGTKTKRVSYAIPLEIIYTTPLQSWNPYGVEYKGSSRTKLGQTVREGGARNGRMTPEKAYNGTCSNLYYLTPFEFFGGGEVDRDPADTSHTKAVGVLDPSGEVRAMKSSGIRIFLPSISTIGVIRTRWPILPVSNEGHPVWKELEALRDVVMDMKAHLRYFPTDPPFPADILASRNESSVYAVLETSLSHPEPAGLHTHVVRLTKEQYEAMIREKKEILVSTSEENGHSHSLLVKFDRRRFRIVSCDRAPVCFDGHGAELIRER